MADSFLALPVLFFPFSETAGITSVGIISSLVSGGIFIARVPKGIITNQNVWLDESRYPRGKN